MAAPSHPRQLPALRVQIQVAGTALPEKVFTRTFRIGRGEGCDIQITSSLVSREHVEVALGPAGWSIRDLESRNGTFVAGARLSAPEPVRGDLSFRLAVDGPVVRLQAVERAIAATSDRTSTPVDRRHKGGLAAAQTTRVHEPLHRIERYLEDPDTGDAGDHTVMIRRVIQSVRHQHRRRSRVLIFAASAALLVVVTTAAVLALRHAREREGLTAQIAKRDEQLEQSRAAASELFFEVRNIQAQVAQLRMVLEESGQTSFQDQIDRLEESRKRLESRYDDYVESLDLRRGLDPEEQLIYRVARVFNESEFGMPPGFVASVREKMHDYWLSPAGRGRFARAVARAESLGYTRNIAETMQQYGLPPHFFYLAMQESNFDVEALGPLTRWGRAKGMWQFIPSTAERFGLDPGPNANEGFVESSDERHDFAKSTEAAASYLRNIYATLAHASGLLVVASYNWGEHRIVSKLEDLPGPQAIPESIFADIPESAEARSYWNFLDRYRDRMPEETKDYVLKIFAAAVIGEDPRRFGFDFDSPLGGVSGALPSPLATGRSGAGRVDDVASARGQ